MYIRPVHAELDVPTLQTFIQTYPLGLFTTHIPHPTIASLQTTHVPFILDRSEGESSGLGTLRAHLARANPQCKALIATVNEDGLFPEEVLILFNAPVNHYVTPKFYTDTKAATGKVVPTWNYATVQVYGKLRIHHQNNSTTSDFLQQQVEDLTSLGESTIKDGKGEWEISDAPVRYVEGMKRGIIGLEVEITRIEGRFKLSQEDGDGDWRGVVDGFRGIGSEEGRVMAGMIEERGLGRERREQQSPVA